jgi:hypothetical protein
MVCQPFECGIEGGQSRCAGGGMMLIVRQVGVKRFAGDLNPILVTLIANIDVQRDDGDIQFFNHIGGQVAG